MPESSHLRLTALSRFLAVPAITLFCLAMLAYSAYQLMTTLNVPAATATGIPQAGDALQRVHQAHLFGGGDQPSAAIPLSSSLLHGTFAGAGGTASYAIIARSDGQEKSYRVGDRLEDGSEIAAIAVDRVVVRRNGKEEILWLKEQQ